VTYTNICVSNITDLEFRQAAAWALPDRIFGSHDPNELIACNKSAKYRNKSSFIYLELLCTYKSWIGLSRL
jgi:hypothetical protein